MAMIFSASARPALGNPLGRVGVAFMLVEAALRQLHGLGGFRFGVDIAA